MLHGRKRSQRRELTPEELEKANKKLEKVERINAEFLKKRKEKEYSQKTLDMTQKLAVLSPDFDTVWNYRREIILHLNQESSPEEKYKSLCGELMMLVKLMKENPKSYTLWEHRQWCILEGLKIEKYMKKEQLDKVGGGILNNEIKLCQKMLSADERNFHCWNYRSWVVNTQLKQYEEICKVAKVKQQAEGEGEEGTQPNEDSLKLSKLEEELEMTSQMIEKNFSNFSAWHYRSKLLPKIHALYRKISNSDEEVHYKVPLDVIKQELEKIKHAIFTEPNDQSPWNYHRWLVSLLFPVYVTKIEYDEKDQNAIFTFSEVIYNIDDFPISYKDQQLTLTSITNKPEGRVFKATIPGVTSKSDFNVKDCQNFKSEGAGSSDSSSPALDGEKILLPGFDMDDVYCFNELLEEEDDLQLAQEYKERQDKKIEGFKSAMRDYGLYKFL